METLQFYGRLLGSGLMTYGAGTCNTQRSIEVMVAAVLITLAVILAPAPNIEYRD